MTLVSLKYCWWYPSVADEHPRILMYHMIAAPGTTKQQRGLRVAETMFERQVRWLAEQGWQFVTMSELQAMSAPQAKTVAITFDDGYADNFTTALPILQKYAAKATLYLVVDRHGEDWAVKKNPKHNSGELARETKLDDHQVRQMLKDGIFELGGHTLSHCHLPSTSVADKRAEIFGCKTVLEQTFATSVTSFAYPFGHFAEDDVELVKAAGFTNAVTTFEGVDTIPNAFRRKRIKVSGKDNFFAFRLRMRIGFRGFI